jgi:hypothetical protein
LEQIGEALEAGRAYCMRIAGIRPNEKPRGRGYVEAFNRWLKRYGFVKLDQAARKYLLDCMNNRAEIETWRQGLGDDKIKWNHPTTVWRRWQASTKAPRPEGKNASPFARQRESIRKRDEKIAELKRENARLKNELGDGGDAWKATDRALADAFADKCFHGGMGPSKFDELLKKAKLAFDARHAYAAKKEKGKNKPTQRKGGYKDMSPAVGIKTAPHEQGPLQWEAGRPARAMDGSDKEYPTATADVGSGRYYVDPGFFDFKFAGYSVRYSPDRKHALKDRRDLDGDLRTLDEGKAAAERDWQER